MPLRARGERERREYTSKWLEQSYTAAREDCDRAKGILDKAREMPRHEKSARTYDCAQADYDNACFMFDLIIDRKQHFKYIMQAEQKRRAACKRKATILKERAKRDLSPASTATASVKPVHASDVIELDRRNTLAEMQKCRNIIEAVDVYPQNLKNALTKISRHQHDFRRHFAAASESWTKLSSHTAKIVRVLGGLKSSNATEEQIKALSWHDPVHSTNFMAAIDFAIQASDVEVAWWNYWDAQNARQWEHQTKVNQARWDMKVLRYMLEKLDADLEEAKEAEREYQRRRRKRQEAKRKEQRLRDGSPTGSQASSRKSGRRPNVKFDARTPGRGVQKD